MPGKQAREDNGADQRRDVHRARRIEQALEVARLEGLGPAIEFIEQAGIPLPDALRVFTVPRFRRKQGDH